MKIDGCMLRKYEVTKGREGHGYSTLVYWGNHCASEVLDEANGGEPDVDIQDKEAARQVQKAVCNIEACRHIGAYESFDPNDIEDAQVLMANLLLDMKDVEDAYKKIRSKVRQIDGSKENVYVAVAIFGTCSFEYPDMTFSTDIATSAHRCKDPSKIETMIRNSFPEKFKKRKLQGLLYLPYNLNYDFDMSTSEFLDFHNV